MSYGHDQNQQWSNRDALALRANKFNVQTEYALPGNSKFVLSGGLVDSNRFDGFVFDVSRNATTLSNGYVYAAYERPNLFIRTSWTRWDKTSLALLTPNILNDFTSITDRNGSTTQNIRNDVYTTWAQHSFEITKSLRLTYGLNYFHNAVSHVNIFDNAATEDRLGLYVQDEWRLTRTLTAVAGIRYDLHTELNPTYSPRLSLIYKPHENHTFRISGSVAYRPPSILETRADVRNPIPVFMVNPSVVGSRNLQPEKIVSYELGYQGWYFKHRVRARADAFFNHISNFISGAATSDPNVFTFGNIGQADLYGAEVGAEFLATSWLTGFINYATVQIHQTSDLVAAQSFSATRGAPPYKINAGLRAEWENGWNADVVVYHVAAASYPVSFAYTLFSQPPFGGFVPPSNSVGAYTLLNGRVAYRFWREKAEVAVAVFNALNDRHKENPIGEEIGSRVMGWLTLRY